jgi:hypothetical protein
VAAAPPPARVPPAAAAPPPPAPVAPAPVLPRSASAPDPRTLPEVSDDLRSVLVVMSDAVTYDTPAAELFLHPELGLDLLLHPPITDWSVFTPAAVRRRLRVPAMLASFFIECFAQDEPAETMHQYPKAFPQPLVLQCALPVPLPVSVSRDADAATLSLGFFDSLLPAAETEARVRALLNGIYARSALHVTFERVDARFFSPETLDEFAFDFDVPLLARFGAVDPETETQGLSLLVLQTQWDQQRDQDTRAKLDALYAEASLTYCSQCGCLFSVGDGDGCVVPYHPGRRIAFPDGQMEIIEFDDGTLEPITIVNRTCCGETEVDDPGCKQKSVGAHAADPARPFSTASVSVVKVAEATL